MTDIVASNPAFELSQSENPKLERKKPRLTIEQQSALIDAARNQGHVSGLTHNHYRYPARFSPQLVGEIIETFSDEGDLILDPFMGGGTTLVEAVSRQRNVVGSDISTLAAFVSRAKTMVIDQCLADALIRWGEEAVAGISMQKGEPLFEDWTSAGYFRNLQQPGRWRLRKAIAQAVSMAQDERNEQIEMLARCAILRTAQWALDGRRNNPSLSKFKSMLATNCSLVAQGSLELAMRIGKNPAKVEVLNRSVIGIEDDPRVCAMGVPKLIVTSPPYPGVHVLYHRWQVDGRKETSAPFFIANALDGSGEAYYTMGGRGDPKLEAYFTQLRGALSSLSSLANEETIFVQIVAFTHPDWQLQRYLEIASSCGLVEFKLPAMAGERDGRLWRDVPNRKWHAQQKGKTHAAREVLLFHRLV